MNVDMNIDIDIDIDIDTVIRSCNSSSKKRSRRRGRIATARPTKPARVVDLDGIVEGVLRRTDVSVPAALERAPASVAAAVDIEGFAAHGRVFPLFPLSSSSSYFIIILISLLCFVLLEGRFGWEVEYIV